MSEAAPIFGVDCGSIADLAPARSTLHGGRQCPRTPVEAGGANDNAARPAIRRNRLMISSVDSGAFARAAAVSSAMSSWKKASSSRSPGISGGSLRSLIISRMCGLSSHEGGAFIAKRRVVRGSRYELTARPGLSRECGLVFACLIGALVVIAGADQRGVVRKSKVPLPGERRGDEGVRCALPRRRLYSSSPNQSRPGSIQR